MEICPHSGHSEAAKPPQQPFFIFDGVTRLVRKRDGKTDETISPSLLFTILIN